MRLKLFHNCKEATLLISKREEEKLSLFEKVFLQVHILYCKFCRNFSKQSILLKQSLHDLSQKNEAAEYIVTLTEEKKTNLKKEISERLK